MKFLTLIPLLILTVFLNSSLAEEGEEGPANVGPDKGILEVNERLGFKLSPEALKNFEIKSLKLKGDGPWEIPQSAIVTSGEETNLFRLRSGYFKRIDFETIRSTTGKSSTVDSDDLREGDEVVVVGIGFLRVAEISLSGGLDHGHSH